MKRKVIYNRCIGGFILSIEAIVLYYKYKYPEKTLFFYQSLLNCPEFDVISIPESEAKHSDSILVDVLDKDFGPKVSITDMNDYYEHVVDQDFSSIDRHDPILVRVVEELGTEKASGMFSRLAIADIGESLYRIEEYDGAERVVTPETQFEWL